MIARYTFRWNKQTTATGKLLVTIDPNRKVLPRLAALQIHMKAFDGLSSM